MMIIARFVFYVFLIFASFACHASAYENAVTTDNRIKRYIYNPNEVYLIKLHHGFQSYIEFSKSEQIETITIGDTYSWNINTIRNRIFIKPMEVSAKTNMTVITDKRIYQFDLVAQILKEGQEDELMYAVKFFYPKKTKY